MFGKSEDKKGHRPGITLRSVAAMVFCILATSAYTNFSCTYLAEHYQIVEEAIPLPGGLFIGGWGFLTHGYADGGDNIRGAWLYNSWAWFANSFRNPLAQATNAWLDGGEAAEASPWSARMMVFGGVSMAALTLLRQFFSGFWFHPIGFLLGWTGINAGAPWGTLLVAWAIRFTTLKIGGAKAVRDKLLPFFAGAFIGCVLSIAVFTAVNARAFLSGNPNFAIFIP